MGGKGSGRKPKPTILRLLDGNPGKRPLPVDEPEPTAAKSATPPQWLADDAKRLYRKIAKELIELELLTVLDVELLGAYCEAWSQFLLATQRVQEMGPVIWTTTAKGFDVQSKNPYCDTKKDSLATVMQLSSRFGFTPSDRVGLHINPEKAMSDPISEMAAAHRAKREARAAGTG